MFIATITGALAGPKLLVALEEGTGLIGGPAPNVAGATVSATALLAEAHSSTSLTTGTTDIYGRLVLEVPHPGAYAIEIRLEGATGPTYWTSRRVLLGSETELVPGKTLSSDEFGPIRDYTQVSCSAAAQGADTHPVREILLGRFSVLRTEINMHRNRADTLAKAKLTKAPSVVRRDVTAALATNGTTTEIFHALTPFRQRYGPPGGRASEDNDASPPAYAWVVEEIWLLYFLAARATAELDALYVNLQECGVDTVADAPEAADKPDPPVAQDEASPVTQTRDEPVTPKQARLPAPAQSDQVVVRTQPQHTGTVPGTDEDTGADWAGLYVGGHLGGGFADAGYRAGIAGPGIPINIDGDGVLGGFLVGYNHQYDQFVFGIEGDISFGSVSGRTTLAGVSNPRLETDYIATVRARFGYAWDRVLLFGHVGIGFAQMQIEESLQLAASTQTDNTHVGVILGGGVEWALTDTVDLRTEYIYGNFDRRNYTAGPATDSLAFDVHIVRAAITVKLGLLP